MLKSELVNLFGLLSWRREKLILLKAWYLHFRKVSAVHPDLIEQDLSASSCSQLGTLLLWHTNSIPVPMGYEV